MDRGIRIRVTQELSAGPQKSASSRPLLRSMGPEDPVDVIGDRISRAALCGRP